MFSVKLCSNLGSSPRNNVTAINEPKDTRTMLPITQQWLDFRGEKWPVAMRYILQKHRGKNNLQSKCMLRYSRKETEKTSSRNNYTVKRKNTDSWRGQSGEEGMTLVTKQKIHPLFSFSALSVEGKLKIIFRSLKMLVFTHQDWRGEAVAPISLVAMRQDQSCTLLRSHSHIWH